MQDQNQPDIDITALEVSTASKEITQDALTADTVVPWVRDEFVQYVPILLPALVEGWKAGMAAADAGILRQVGEAIGLIQSKTGPTFINNNQINNSITTVPSKISLESLIRDMDNEYHASKRKSAPVVEAEFTDVDAKG